MGGGLFVGGLAYLNDDLIAQQCHTGAARFIAVRQLQILCHLQWFFARLQTSTVFRWEITDPAQALALPPVRIRGIDYRYFVASCQIQFIGMPSFEIVQNHVQIVWEQSMRLLLLSK